MAVVVAVVVVVVRRRMRMRRRRMNDDDDGCHEIIGPAILLCRSGVNVNLGTVRGIESWY